MRVFEVLVPTLDPNGNRWAVEHHQEWDSKVLEMTGGLTLYSMVKGRWVLGGKVVAEDMIPVRVACTIDQLNEVLAFTGRHYDQAEVIAWAISDYVSLWTRREEVDFQGYNRS